MKQILAWMLALAAGMLGGCAHRAHRLSMLSPTFPNVTTPLPQGAGAWVCDFKTGFQVCDAVALNGNGVFTRLTTGDRESLNGYIRVNQKNGMIVFWHVRETMPPQSISEGCYRQNADQVYCPPKEW